MKKPTDEIKTDYGNIPRKQYLESTMMEGKTTINRFKKWLKRKNKLLGTSFTINDFDDEPCRPSS